MQQCGQEVHKECFLNMLNLSPDTNEININPLGIPGVHYLCPACELSTVPDMPLKNCYCAKRQKMSYLLSLEPLLLVMWYNLNFLTNRRKTHKTLLQKFALTT